MVLLPLILLCLVHGKVLHISAEHGECEPTPPAAIGSHYRTSNKHQPFWCDSDTSQNHRLIVRGRIMDVDCKTPIKYAHMEVWQADENGDYDISGSSCQGTVRVDSNGHYNFSTNKPGHHLTSSGKMRPANIHFLIKSPRHRMLVTQLYFSRDPYLGENDPCSHCNSGEPALLMTAQLRERAGVPVTVVQYDFKLQPARARKSQTNRRRRSWNEYIYRYGVIPKRKADEIYLNWPTKSEKTVYHPHARSAHHMAPTGPNNKKRSWWNVNPYLFHKKIRNTQILHPLLSPKRSWRSYQPNPQNGKRSWGSFYTDSYDRSYTRGSNRDKKSWGYFDPESDNEKRSWGEFDGKLFDRKRSWGDFNPDSNVKRSWREYEPESSYNKRSWGEFEPEAFGTKRSWGDFEPESFNNKRSWGDFEPESFNNKRSWGDFEPESFNNKRSWGDFEPESFNNKRSWGDFEAESVESKRSWGNFEPISYSDKRSWGHYDPESFSTKRSWGEFEPVHKNKRNWGELGDPQFALQKDNGQQNLDELSQKRSWGNFDRKGWEKKSVPSEKDMDAKISLGNSKNTNYNERDDDNDETGTEASDENPEKDPLGLSQQRENDLQKMSRDKVRWGELYGFKPSKRSLDMGGWNYRTKKHHISKRNAVIQQNQEGGNLDKKRKHEDGVELDKMNKDSVDQNVVSELSRVGKNENKDDKGFNPKDKHVLNGLDEMNKVKKSWGDFGTDPLHKRSWKEFILNSAEVKKWSDLFKKRSWGKFDIDAENEKSWG